MKAIILAAGESSRFWPLNKKHKSLFKMMQKPLICYTLENLKRAGVKEIIVVQRQKGDIEKELKECELVPNVKIKYVLQRKPLGTGDALKAAEKYLQDKFLALNGDDFYETEDIKKCLSKFPSLLVKNMAHAVNFGVIVPQKNYVKEIIEKSEKPPTNLVNAGCYFLSKAIFKEKIKKSHRGEYEIIDYIRNLSKKTKVYFLKVENWFPLSYGWDLLDINEYLLKNIKSKIKGKIEKNCHIKPPVIIEERTIVKTGAYIEGPVYIGKNCRVGPNCYIRPCTSIGENCVVGQAVEVKNSIIGNDSKIGHLSYVADSIIGEDCNLGAGTILANLRFDGKNINAIVKGKKINTQRKKIGAVLGKGVKIGINSSIMPGVLIGENATIGPHSLVMKNIGDNKIYYSNQQK